jgi:hypothetical protein
MTKRSAPTPEAACSGGKEVPLSAPAPLFAARIHPRSSAATNAPAPIEAATAFLLTVFTMPPLPFYNIQRSDSSS